MRALHVLDGELEAVTKRMHHAVEVAQSGGLHVAANLIFPPKPVTMSKPQRPDGRMSAEESRQHSDAVAQFEAAQAEHARKQQAYEEARATVQDARQKEHTAHRQFADAMNKVLAQLQDIPNHDEWAKAGQHPSTPAASSLAQTAGQLDEVSAKATHSMLTRASSNGPAATNAAWSVMTSAQRTELINQHPKMVGSTDGVPVVARDQANRSILGSERARLENRLKNIKETVRKHGSSKDGFTRQLIDESQ